ncbi:MAG: hypothetical protein LCH30_08610 [Proteobacteria bacterium]|nr:hypothetical protein [Pseudomonadota bacterium]
MLRQALIYLLLSLLVVIFARYAYLLIAYIGSIYAYLNAKLMPIFSHTGLGITIQKVLLLVLIPLILAAIPALIYRLIRGKDMPYFLELTWCLWLIIVLSKILLRY